MPWARRGRDPAASMCAGLGALGKPRAPPPVHLFPLLTRASSGVPGNHRGTSTVSGPLADSGGGTA